MSGGDDNNGFTKKDFEDTYVETEPTSEVPPIEQARRAAQTLARAFESLPEVKKVVDVKSGPGRVWLLLRIQGEKDQARFINTTACEILHHFNERSGFEVVISKQLIPVKSALQQKTVKYGWAVAAGATDIQALLREFSNCMAEFGPKLRVAESALVGPGTPGGSFAAGGGDGKRGAQIIKPAE